MSLIAARSAQVPGLSSTSGGSLLMTFGRVFEPFGLGPGKGHDSLYAQAAADIDRFSANQRGDAFAPAAGRHRPVDVHLRSPIDQAEARTAVGHWLATVADQPSSEPVRVPVSGILERHGRAFKRCEWIITVSGPQPPLDLAVRQGN